MGVGAQSMCNARMERNSLLLHSRQQKGEYTIFPRRCSHVHNVLR